MKENKYDNDVFFKKYSEMTRSKCGLAGAGEWQELRKLLPDFNRKEVLDLGCGYGWHCIYAVQNGAAHVIGADISKKMLNVAKAKNSDPAIEYREAAMEDLSFKENSFDIIISSLAFHYIQDFKTLAENINGWLKPGGSLVFSVEHPVFTAYGSQDWYYDDAGKILHFPVDNYYYEGKREAVFLGETVTKYHRTLTTYLNTLLNNDLLIEHIVEPQPPQDMLDEPSMKEEMRRPMMLLVSARKKDK